MFLDGDTLIDCYLDGIHLAPEQLVVRTGNQKVLIVLGLHFQLLDLGVYLIDLSENRLVCDWIELHESICFPHHISD
jgi:hypothetical protein